MENLMTLLKRVIKLSYFIHGTAEFEAHATVIIIRRFSIKHAVIVSSVEPQTKLDRNG